MKDRKKTYWLCLAERDGGQDQSGGGDEFPGLPSTVETSRTGVTRRDFLRLMGFGAAAASFSCSSMPVHKAIPYLVKPEEILPGKSYRYASTCGACPAVCGILVKCRDGRPIKIEGNPLSPIARGGLCAVGQAGVLSLYDSGRLHGPSWRGETVSWAEADRGLSAEFARLRAEGGAVRVMTGSSSGPSLARALAGFLASFSDAKHVVYDAVSYSGLLEAAVRLTGRRVIPRYDFSRARVIVSIAADFLGTWLSPVEFTKAYASARRIGDSGRPMAHHIQFESVMTLTGAGADRRVRIRPSEELAVADALLNAVRAVRGQVRRQDTPRFASEEILQAVERAASRLASAGGEALVVAGSNDPAVQETVWRLNAEVGAVGKTVDLSRPSLQRGGVDADTASLVTEMEAGSVACLVLHGVNPVYDWHDPERFATAMGKVPLVVSLNPYRDETGELAPILCPDSHFLESFGDFEPRAGTYHLAQPTLRQIYDTRPALASFLAWTGQPSDPLEFIRAVWREEIYPRARTSEGFEPFWTRAIHDGVVVLKEVLPAVLPVAGAFDTPDENRPPLVPSSPASFELALYEPVALRDGALANNPWLQELPDPVSKVTWGNFAALSPVDADKLGVKDGDVVRIESAGRQAALPVLVQAGQAEGVVAAALGYGRTRAGKVGDAVGENVFALVRWDGKRRRFRGGAATVATTGAVAKLAGTQTHHTMEGRNLVREMSEGEYRRGVRAESGEEREAGTMMLWDARERGKPSWGMAVDLNACTGCGACVIACQAENNVAVVGREEVLKRREMHWIRIDRYYEGSTENPAVLFQPVMCQHCANAPCESVCPVLATLHSQDGLNQQVYNRCVGTRYCANNCPYKVRRFNWFDYADNERFDFNMNDATGKLALNPDLVVRTRGVMEKCSLCVQRIQEGKLNAKLEKRALRDGEIATACGESCPADAIVFGDLSDPKSRVSRLVRGDSRRYRLLAELNTQPAVSYLAKVRSG